MAGWQSGYAAACKAVDAGSIPASASITNKLDTLDTHSLVIGGGIIGLAIARELSKTSSETILIEKNARIAEETSARNSGVIHAGFYYPVNSYKSLFCNQGNKLIYKYCEKNSIFHRKVGKIVVGQDKDYKLFKQFQDNAIKVGGKPLQLLNSSEIQELEPLINSKIGLFSPETGIVDVHGLCNAYCSDLLENNGLISLQTEIKKVHYKNNKFHCILRDAIQEYKIISEILIISMGLHSPTIKNIFSDLNSEYIFDLNLTKGHYYKYSQKNPFKHLIYPVPDELGLGIHSTIDIDNSVRFGPDSVEVKMLNYNFEEGVKEKFYKKIKKYFPSIKIEDLSEDFVGIRPKILSTNKNYDFSILFENQHGIRNFAILQGIESPGITSSLAIGKYVFNKLNLV